MNNRDENASRMLMFFGLIGCLFCLAPMSFAQQEDSRYWNVETDLASESDPEYQRSHTLIATPWGFSRKHAGVAYFVYQSPAKIERFDLINEQWLPVINLAEMPTAFTVDDAGIYISFGRRTSRFDPDGANEVHLRNTVFDIHELFSWNDYLTLIYSDTYMTIHKQTGAISEIFDGFYRASSIRVSSKLSTAFGRSNGFSPTDMVRFQLFPDGTLGAIQDSPYHGDYPFAEKAWLTPDEDHVLDNSGIVYHTADLTYAGSLGGGFDDLDFYGDQPVALRDQTFTLYSPGFIDQGQFVTGIVPLGFFVNGEQLYAFYENEGALGVEIIALSAFTAPQPAPVVDPTGLAYVPDQILADKDGVVYLLNRDQQNLFRWSSRERRYLTSIPLLGSPDHLAYSEAHHALYITYPGGPVRRVSLDQSLAESTFFNASQTPLAVAAAGAYLFLCDPSGPWVSYYTYTADGTLVAQEAWNRESPEFIWSQVNRKMYFIGFDLTWREIDEDGLFGFELEMPFGQNFPANPPLRLVYGDSLLLTGSGVLFDAETLTYFDTLPVDIADAGMMDERLVTTRAMDSDTQVQVWSNNFVEEQAVTLTGEPLSLLPIPGSLLVITSIEGVPSFKHLSQCLLEGGNPLHRIGQWPEVPMQDLVSDVAECL